MERQMLPAGPVSPDLNQPLALRRSLRRGWRSFNRTAGRFVIFMLIVEAISEVSHLLVLLGSTPPEQGGLPTFGVVLSLGLGLGLTLLTHWWMTVGLFRGAWLVLTGGQPRLADLLRWDGETLRRWMAMWFLIVFILALLGAVTGLIWWTMTLLIPPLAMVIPVVGALLGLILVLSQLFCLPLVALERLSPLQALRLGLEGLRRHPLAWLLLGLIQVLPQLLMLISNVLGGGLVLGVRLVTLPLAMCILTAVYLDRPEPRTTLNGTPVDRETGWRDSSG